MRKIYYYLTFCLTVALFGLPIYAITPKESTSSSQIATSSGAIDQIREAVREKVEDRLGQIEDRPVGIIGQVTKLTDQSITILADKDDYSITTTGATNYLKIPGRTVLTRPDIALQDYILVKGRMVNTQATISATEIQVIPTPDLPERELLTGKITQISKSEIKFTVGQDNYSIPITATTPIRDISALDTALKLTNLSVNDTLTVAGTLSSKVKNQFNPGYILRLKSATSREPKEE